MGCPLSPELMIFRPLHTRDHVKRQAQIGMHIFLIGEVQNKLMHCTTPTRPRNSYEYFQSYQNILAQSPFSFKTFTISTPDYVGISYSRQIACFRLPDIFTQFYGSLNFEECSTDADVCSNCTASFFRNSLPFISYFLGFMFVRFN